MDTSFGRTYRYRLAPKVERKLRFRATGDVSRGLLPSAATQIEDAETGQILPYLHFRLQSEAGNWVKAAILFSGGSEWTEMYLTDVTMEGIVLAPATVAEGNK